MPKLWQVVRVMLKGEKLATSGFNISAKKRRQGLLSRLGLGKLSGGSLKTGYSRTIKQALLFTVLFGLFIFYGYSIGRILIEVEPFVILILRAVALFISIFSVFNVVTLLYYSEELPFYLSLPLSKGTLVGAKLIHATIYNVIFTLAMMIWPLFIGLGMKMGVPIAFYPASIWLSLIVGLSAQAIISTILVIVMRFTKFAKNKDRFTMVFSAIMILIVIAVSMAPGFMAGSSSTEHMSIEEEQRMMTEMLQMGQNAAAINVTSAILAPPLLIIGRMDLWSNGFLAPVPFLLANLVTVALCALLFVVARRLYVDGAMAVQGTGGKKRGKLSSTQVARGLRRRSPFRTLVKKDWLILRRTPTYFTNYLMSTFLIPVILLFSMAIPLFVSQDAPSISTIIELLKPLPTIWTDPDISQDVIRWGYLIIMIFIPFLMSMNVLSTSMISREGESAYLMKMMPQTYLLQIRSKLFLGSLLGFLSTFLFFFAALIILRPPWYILLTYLLIYFSDVYLSQVFDGLLDITFPRLDWSQDIEIAKRQGLTFASFGVSFGIIAAKVAVYYFFSEYVSRDPIVLTVFVVAIYLVLNFVAELLLRMYAQNKLETMIV